MIGIALALEFVVLAAGRDTVLLLRDCRGAACRPWETQFHVTTPKYIGDAARLEKELTRRDIRYKEVWLDSGGGHLYEGIAVGRLFRRLGTTVRVPKGAFCASSCTVAFVGGLFRFIDDSASFVVHSASRVMGGLDDSTDARLKDGRLRQHYRITQAVACERSLELLQYFQHSLLLLKGTKQTPPTISVNRCAPANRYPDEAEAKDRQRLEVEGIAAAQDILMRLERETMMAALESWRAQLASLGDRAGPAIRMVEAMYDTSILDGQDLSRETLLRLGYVTQLVDRPGAPPP
jgi:hypothetical protein